MGDTVMTRCARSNQALGLAAVPRERPHVRLREFFAEDAIKLQLESTTKDDVLKELVGLLKLDDKADQTLVKMLKRRETLGSTGIGQNIAIPHCPAPPPRHRPAAFSRQP